MARRASGMTFKKMHRHRPQPHRSPDAAKTISKRIKNAVSRRQQTASIKGGSRQTCWPRTFRDALIKKWAADISFVWTAEGWLYLAIVLDLFSRRIIGFAMSRPDEEGLWP